MPGASQPSIAAFQRAAELQAGVCGSAGAPGAAAPDVNLAAEKGEDLAAAFGI